MYNYILGNSVSFCLHSIVFFSLCLEILCNVSKFRLVQPAVNWFCTCSFGRSCLWLLTDAGFEPDFWWNICHYFCRSCFGLLTDACFEPAFWLMFLMCRLRKIYQSFKNVVGLHESDKGSLQRTPQILDDCPWRPYVSGRHSSYVLFHDTKHTNSFVLTWNSVM